MEFLKKIAKRETDPFGSDAVNIVLLGDSVTQGCFECFVNSRKEIDTVCDTESSYGFKFVSLLQMLYPRAQINLINIGISGDNSARGLERLERDVLRYDPDLTVVSYGLNDCGFGEDGLNGYGNNLRSIFSGLKKAGSEVVFLAPCMMNEYVSPFITDEYTQGVSQRRVELQLRGVVEKYFTEARAAAREYGVPVCDGVALWKRMSEHGVDTTEQLANKINHPVRRFHDILACMLLETVFMN